MAEFGSWGGGTKDGSKLPTLPSTVKYLKLDNNFGIVFLHPRQIT